MIENSERARDESSDDRWYCALCLRLKIKGGKQVEEQSENQNKEESVKNTKGKREHGRAS